MPTEPRDRPAALAALAYIAGLVAAPVVVSVPIAAGGLVLVAVLSTFLRNCRGVRIAVLCLVAAGGLLVGGRLEDRRSLERSRMALESSNAFSTVRLEIEDDWAPRADGAWRLKARSFELVGRDGSAFRFRCVLHVLLYDDPPSIEGAGRMTARGFLREIDPGRYVLSVKSADLLEPAGRPSPADPVEWKRWFSRRLDAAGQRSARAQEGNALVQALVLGRGALVPWEVIELYQRGGTYHLLVFSGVQIAMMAWLVRWVLVRLRFRRAADFALLFICAVVPRFVGADPSVTRSALMIGLLIGCWLWERPTDAANLLFVSAVVRLVMVPDDLVDPGFALTYSATAGILVLGRRFAEGRGRIGRIVAYGLGAELGTSPFTLYFFNRATLGGSLVTLAVSPVVTAMLALGFCAVALSTLSITGAGVLLEIVGFLNQGVMWVNRLVAEDLRLSVIAASPGLSVLVVALVIAVLAASRGSKRAGVVVAACLLVPLGASVVRSMPDNSEGTRICFLDVGQGDATLVVSRGRALLVDGGGSASDPAFGARTLLPLLAERRARKLDAILLSHPHPDHCQGLVIALRDLDVGRVILSRRHVATPCGTALMDVATRRGIPVVDAESSRSMVVGAVTAEIFGTSQRYRRAWENNSSVLVRLSVNGRRVLLTGDVEREAELVLLEQSRSLLAADVLKVAHHGSKTSSSQAFVAAVGPRIAVISCGVRNRFGHPHAGPVAVLSAAGARIEATSLEGTVEILESGGLLSVLREIDCRRMGS